MHHVDDEPGCNDQEEKVQRRLQLLDIVMRRQEASAWWGLYLRCTRPNDAWCFRVVLVSIDHHWLVEVVSMDREKNCLEHKK